jgi:sRNA-binding protein
MALVHYMGGPGYLGVLIEGARRCNLDGDTAGMVTAGQARRATQRLTRIRAHNLRQEEAARQQRPDANPAP